MKNVILLFKVDIENSKRMNEKKKNMKEVGDHLNIYTLKNQNKSSTAFVKKGVYYIVHSI